MSKGKRAIAVTLLMNVLAAIISAPVVGLISYYSGQASAAGTMADGLAILDAEGTADSLQEMASSCENAQALLALPHPSLIRELVKNLQKEMGELSKAISEVKTTEYYSVDEINQLTDQVGFYSDKKGIIDSHLGKPKRVVQGLYRLDPCIVRIRESLENLDRSLEREGSPDVSGLASFIAKMQRDLSAAEAVVTARHAAALQTLGQFDRRLSEAPPARTQVLSSK